jgi:hypothetical protein
MELSDASNGQLWQVCRKLPSDFEPYGERKWEGKSHEKPDCSICRWFQPLLPPESWIGEPAPTFFLHEQAC